MLCYGNLIMEESIKGNNDVYTSEGRNKFSYLSSIHSGKSQEINNFMS
jgi:hypothetical protein